MVSSGNPGGPVCGDISVEKEVGFPQKNRRQPLVNPWLHIGPGMPQGSAAEAPLAEGWRDAQPCPSGGEGRAGGRLASAERSGRAALR